MLIDDIVAPSNHTGYEDVEVLGMHIDEAKATFPINCIGFDTAGNIISNSLMGQWCFNLSNANETIQSSLPRGISGNNSNKNLLYLLIYL